MSGCTGKSKYSNTSAKKVMEKMRKQFPFKKFRVYRCPHCNRFHLTHSKEPR